MLWLTKTLTQLSLSLPTAVNNLKKRLMSSILDLLVHHLCGYVDFTLVLFYNTFHETVFVFLWACLQEHGFSGFISVHVNYSRRLSMVFEKYCCPKCALVHVKSCLKAKNKQKKPHLRQWRCRKPSVVYELYIDAKGALRAGWCTACATLQQTCICRTACKWALITSFWTVSVSECLPDPYFSGHIREDLLWMV